MELDIVYLDTSVLLGGVCILDEELIIDAELALRHPTELGLNQNLPNYICLKHSATLRKQYINVLHYVDEDLIALVSDAFSSPRDSTGRLDRNLLQLLNILYKFQHYKLPQFLTVTPELPSLPCVMYILRRSGSSICGNPKSMTSSSSSYISAKFFLTCSSLNS